MKVILITNIPNPYRLPLFSELNRRLKEQGDDLLVLFAAEKYDRRKFELDSKEFQFSFQILGSKVRTLGNEEKAFFSYSHLSAIFKKEKPGVIISAGFNAATLKAWFYKLRSRCKLIIWSGSVSTTGKDLSRLRTYQRKFLVRNADAYVAYGTRSANYLMLLGAKEKSVYKALNTVDTTFFRKETAKLKDSVKEMDNLKHLTYVGYLSNRKRVDVLLDVFRLLCKNRQDVVLDIVGDGSAKTELEVMANEKFPPGKVIFHGFRQKEEVPAYLAQSDVFVFQTGSDIWGLVLNEAMAAGLTCIASPNAGAVDDLITDGETGFVCNFEDTDKAVGLINNLLDDEAERRRIGENAARFMAQHAGISQSVEGFMKAINSVKGNK